MSVGKFHVTELHSSFLLHAAPIHTSNSIAPKGTTFTHLHISILYQALPYYSLNTPPPLHCPPSPNHVRKCEHFDVNVVTILRSVKGTIIIQL